MKRVTFLFLAVALLHLFSQCTKKTLELEVVETKCKNFKISDASAQIVNSSICGTDPSFRTIEVTFRYDGDMDCIDLVEVDAKFVDTNDTQLSNISFNPLIYKSDSVISIASSSVTFKFCYKFNDIKDTAVLSYIHLNFHTENEQQNESNSLGVMIPIPNKPLHPQGYTITQTISVDNYYLTAHIYDNAAEDGDIISLNLNGKWILKNFTLTKSGTDISIQVKPGNNILVMYAMNLGSSPPNTAAIKITDNLKTHEVVLNSKEGEKEAIKLVY